MNSLSLVVKRQSHCNVNGVIVWIHGLAGLGAPLFKQPNGCFSLYMLRLLLPQERWMFMSTRLPVQKRRCVLEFPSIAHSAAKWKYHNFATAACHPRTRGLRYADYTFGFYAILAGTMLRGRETVVCELFA